MPKQLGYTDVRPAQGSCLGCLPESMWNDGTRIRISVHRFTKPTVVRSATLVLSHSSRECGHWMANGRQYDDPATDHPLLLDQRRQRRENKWRLSQGQRKFREAKCWRTQREKSNWRLGFNREASPWPLLGTKVTHPSKRFARSEIRCQERAERQASKGYNPHGENFHSRRNKLVAQCGHLRVPFRSHSGA